MTNSPARRTPIAERPGWFLTSVNRETADGSETTEVAVTYFEGDEPDGQTLTFRLPGAQPRAVILAAAADHIDRWSRDA